MGGWALRLADLKVAVSSNTGTQRYENQQLQRLINLSREIKEHLDTLVTKADDLKGAEVRGKSRLALLPPKDVEDMGMKVHDLKDQLAFMCKTHQFAFNSQLEEYIKRHVSDCRMYTESEEQTLHIERKAKEQKGWLIHQCEVNINELHEAVIQFDSLKVVFHERNKVVLQNEGYIIHILHNVAKLVECADGFLQIYHAEVPVT